jgi:hypothetical protein
MLSLARTSGIFAAARSSSRVAMACLRYLGDSVVIGGQRGDARLFQFLLRAMAARPASSSASISA